MNAKTDKTSKKYLYSEFYDRMVGILTGKNSAKNKRVLNEWANPLGEDKLVSMFLFDPNDNSDNSVAYKTMSIRRLYPAFSHFGDSIIKFLDFFIQPNNKKALSDYVKEIRLAYGNCNQKLPEAKEVGEMFRAFVSGRGRAPTEDEMKNAMSQSVNGGFLQVFDYGYRRPVSEFLQQFYHFSDLCVDNWSSVLKREIMGGPFFKNFSGNIFKLRGSLRDISQTGASSRINVGYLQSLINIFSVASLLIDSLEYGLDVAGVVGSGADSTTLDDNDSSEDEDHAEEKSEEDGKNASAAPVDGEEKEQEKDEERKERQEEEAQRAAEEMLNDKSDTGDDDLYKKSFEELGRMVRQGIRIIQDMERVNKSENERFERLVGRSYDEVLKSDIDKMLKKIQGVKLNKVMVGEVK